jgi:hypothetical protein
MAVIFIDRSGCSPKTVRIQQCSSWMLTHEFPNPSHSQRGHKVCEHSKDDRPTQMLETDVV